MHRIAKALVGPALIGAVLLTFMMLTFIAAKLLMYLLDIAALSALFGMWTITTIVGVALLRQISVRFK